MRYFTLAKDEFELLVYPAMSLESPGQNGSEMEQRQIGKALDILETCGTVTPLSLTEMMKDRGYTPFCVMTNPSHDFAMEDAYFEVMLRQLARRFTRLPGGHARPMQKLIDRLRAAPTELVKPEETNVL
jgi:hypothetical protein